ncbi:ComEC/Rec2 family competence protein [Psychrobacter sp. PP-21]|uniref:ComEC/Rec2 family competence protein n=1 Tax=Psychrobacter sp. PP-21 TaxID=2957503 RepID=UPI0029AE97C5|nr:ComEC/Rec2 family competence protein [Psychrobacter sp. PP-21]MDX2373155.1 ComEC/Rec2 family competence protein [Psychrobacter sp. PP-21]
MYWLIGSLVVIAMMGTLTVADKVAIPTELFSIGVASTSGLFILLILFSIILLTLTQFHVSSATNHHTSSSILKNAERSSRIVKYFLFTILATLLVAGSALQALVTHHKAAAAEITDPIRVQALVRIEGLSDSVYSPSADSGYRQVAVLTNVTPLITELTPQDLANSTRDYIAKNSLSNNNTNSSNQDNDSNVTYRALLNSYPKSASTDATLSNLNNLQPGDTLFMSLALAPLVASDQTINNASGFDSYRWLRGRHIDGSANILAISLLTVSNNKASLNEASHQDPTSDSYLERLRLHIDIGRWQLRQHFYRDWSAQTTAEQQAKAVTLSLLTGDRSLINRDTKDLYQLAGISHLLAISGTHVLFLAIVLGGLIVLLLNQLCPALYRYIPRWQVRWWTMIGAAFIYALFTGFDVPAARTAWMLLAIGLVRVTLLPISTMRVLLALAILMAWYDPYVLWQAGYWLSFIAVALLLKYDDTSHQHSTAESVVPYTNSKSTHKSKKLFGHALRAVWRIFKLQFWLFFTLLPITLLLFGKASLWGLVVNLFAIGLFGWVIVPLNLLAGLCYLLSPMVADTIWSLVITIVGSLHELIGWLTSLPALSEAWLYTPVSMAILLMVVLSILPWLLPRGLLSRWLILPPLTLLMMTVYANQQSLTIVPTLYVLPTGDSYITAALLTYPTVNKESSNWLFLANHRPASTRTTPNSLTADTLSASLEQQLGSLSVNRLESVIVQSSSVGLTDTLTSDNQRMISSTNNSELLPKTVVHLGERLPISRYWQAGRSEHWLTFQQAYKTTSGVKSQTNISAQNCEQGSVWQLANGDISIQAMTGWSQIGDASVWDCTIAIDSRTPIQVRRYNATDPLKSSPINPHLQLANSYLDDSRIDTSRTDTSRSRLILDTDTHQRVWQMWSLLCTADLADERAVFENTTWLGHSTSQVTADVMVRQSVDTVMIYDDKPLPVALSLNTLDNSVDIEAVRPQE